MNKPPEKPVERRHKGAIRRQNESRILQAAEAVFSRQGFRGASIGMIAEAAGVPKPNVYYYFSSKEDLYRKVIEGICGDWLRAAECFDTTEDPAVAILGYVRAKMDLARKRPDASRIWAIEMARGAPIIRPYLENVVKPWVEGRAAVVEHWIETGALDPVCPHTLFYMIWATTQHYADFEAQITAINEGPLDDAAFTRARREVERLILSALNLSPPA
ncbi:TetR family transcriptional regulator C-terminal domain-containing protein [Yunchengibacter salinarum]|uniref:TetR family transcriptional regulator C-terminal domain-containing protein n=1 Tax=Yunchengibacter salinarum TaxID=3133399 RepID=UPI0035B6558A